MMSLLGPAHADNYPVKPVRFIVAFPAGAHADQVARLIGQKLTETLGRPFVIDNRGGAGGIIGEELAARSAPDGHTMVLVSISHVINPLTLKSLAYDPMRDLIPVSLAVSAPNVLLTHVSLGARTVPELIAFAKKHPGAINYGYSQATSSHVSTELFKSMAGVDLTGITYKSLGLAYPDLEAGRIHMTFSVITGAISSVKRGNTRILAVTSAKRSPVLPDTPAIAEFLPGYEMTGWQGILVPAGTPRPIVARLSDEVAKAVRAPEAREKLLAGGAHPVGSTPEEFARFRQGEFAKYSKLALQAVFKPER